MEECKEKIVVLKCGCGLTGINPVSFLIDPRITRRDQKRLAGMFGIRYTGNIVGKCRLCEEPIRLEPVWRSMFIEAKDRYFETHPELKKMTEKLSKESYEEYAKILGALAAVART